MTDSDAPHLVPTAPHPLHINTSWRINVDPRIKLLALITVNVMVMGSGSFALSLLAALCLVPFLIGHSHAHAIACWLTWIALWAAMFLFVPMIAQGWVPTVLAALGFWFTRFSVCAGYAWWLFVSTRVGHLSAALQTIHVPRFIITPLAVMIRFVPSLLNELRAIWDSMRLRGLIPSASYALRHPIRTSEFILVPLLSSATRMADELAASALLRGLGNPTRRTSVVSLRLGWGDVACMCMLALLITARVFDWEVTL